MAHVGPQNLSCLEKFRIQYVQIVLIDKSEKHSSCLAHKIFFSFKMWLILVGCISFLLLW